jgi:hypothetical protein
MFNKRSYSKLIARVHAIAKKHDIEIEAHGAYYKFTNASGSIDLSSGLSLAEAYAWFDGWIEGRNLSITF